MGNRTSRLDAQPLTSFTLPNVAQYTNGEGEKKTPTLLLVGGRAQLGEESSGVQLQPTRSGDHVCDEFT